MEFAVEFNRQELEAALLSGRKYSYLPFDLHIFDIVSSTNQTVWELLERGAQPGCVVIAQQQTSGRGQWGRQWISPQGGLYLSVAIAPLLSASNSYQLTLASAWGIARQLRNCGVTVGIKWPNDLVLNKRKLGGILTETKVSKSQITSAVIGVGINWANPVPETGINLQSWQASQDSKAVASKEILAAQVLLGIESGMKCLFVEGVDILLHRYLELLTNMGEKVYLNHLSGLVVGVTPSGELRVCLQKDDNQTVKTSEKNVTEISLHPGTISLGYSKSSD